MTSPPSKSSDWTDIISNNLSNTTINAKKHKKTGSKKNDVDDGRPRRPLTSYNIFFQIERNRIMQQQMASGFAPMENKRNPKRNGKHANVGFANLARIVAARWKSLRPATKRWLDEQAWSDKERYKREMEEWLANPRSSDIVGSLGSTSSPCFVKEIDPNLVKMMRNPRPCLQMQGTTGTSLHIVTPKVARPSINKKEDITENLGQPFPALPFSFSVASKIPKSAHVGTYQMPKTALGINQSSYFCQPVVPKVRESKDKSDEEDSRGNGNDMVTGSVDDIFDVHGFNYNGFEAMHKDEIEDVVRGLYSKRRSQFLAPRGS
ncbi:hypothetical protein ACHAXS_007767 [Conticribra weissflogii]